jgi:Laminin G domain
VALNEWHTVRMTRTGRYGTLKVDGGPTVEGRSQGSFTQLTLSLDLFIGGHRNYDETAKSADVDRSFTGCIQQVLIRRQVMVQLRMGDGVILQPRSISFLHDKSYNPCCTNLTWFTILAEDFKYIVFEK